MAEDIEITGRGANSGFAAVQNKFKIHMGGLNVSLLTVAFDGPAKPEVLLTTCRDGSVDCTYNTPMDGEYKIHITFDGEHCEGSPFSVTLLGEDQFTTEKVKISGKGLLEGKSRIFNEILVDPNEAGITCSLTAVLEAPPSKMPPSTKPECILSNNDDGTTTIKYKPTIVGIYKLHLKYMDRPLPGSPFNIKVK